MKLATAILVSIAAPLASAAANVSGAVDPTVRALLAKIEEDEADRAKLMKRVKTLSAQINSLEKAKNAAYHSTAPKAKKNQLRRRLQDDEAGEGIEPQGAAIDILLDKLELIESAANCLEYDSDYEESGYSVCVVGDSGIDKVRVNADDFIGHYAEDIVVKASDSVDIIAKSSSVDIKAWSGDIEIEGSDDVKIEASNSIDFNAPGTFGSVDLKAEDSVDIVAKSSSVDIKAYSGDISIEASDDVNIKASDGSIDLKAKSGDVDIKAKDSLDLIAKDSSLDMYASSDISMEASQDVKIVASDGSIDLKAWSGSIDMEASSSVDIEASDHSVDIRAGTDVEINGDDHVVIQGYHITPNLIGGLSAATESLTNSTEAPEPIDDFDTDASASEDGPDEAVPDEDASEDEADEPASGDEAKPEAASIASATSEDEPASGDEAKPEAASILSASSEDEPASVDDGSAGLETSEDV